VGLTGSAPSSPERTPSPARFHAQLLLPPRDGAPVRGRALALTHPISFWGGVDPATGRIIDARHPQRGAVIAGRILFLPGTIGSSSASAVLLELVHAGLAPAALVLHEPDAILLLGCVVAREMGWPAPPAYRMPREVQGRFAERDVAIAPDGTIAIDAAPA
jgi:predicted aconitase with swiveling domain